MAPPFISRGFVGRRRGGSDPGRIPPGQHEVKDFPVLSAGPTPQTSTATWDFQITGAVQAPRRWTWDEFWALPTEPIMTDIHCVTKWTKLDTQWVGVSLDTLLGLVQHQAKFLVAHCDGGYTTNLPLDRVTGGKAWVVSTYDGTPLPAEHGGPARLLVPQLYFWKSAKWVRGLELLADDRPGFWESLGYSNEGDPWQEQRYQGD